jgi:hypothetical protein
LRGVPPGPDAAKKIPSNKNAVVNASGSDESIALVGYSFALKILHASALSFASYVYGRS